MKLKKISWSNYKQYKESGELLLEDLEGTIGVLGNNGSGKSSLLRIIVIALFGIKGAKEKKEFLRTHGVEKEPVFLRLEFEHDKNVNGKNIPTSYIIEREYRGVNLTPKASFWELIDGYPSLLAEDVGLVDSYVKKVIGIDADAFLSTIFCQQKELDKLSEMDPAEIKKFILKLGGVNKIDDEIKLTREKIRDSQKFLVILREDMANKEKVENSIIELDREVKTLQKNLAKLDTELKKIEDAHALTSEEKKEYDEKYTQFNTLSLEKVKLLGKVDSATQEIGKLTKEKEDIIKIQEYMESEGNMKLQEYKNLESEISALEDDRLKFSTKTQLESQLSKIKSEGSNIKAKIEKVNADIKGLNFNLDAEKEINESLNAISLKIKTLTNDKIELTSEYKAINSKIKENNDELANIANLVKNNNSDNGCKCPTCKQSVSSEHVEIIRKHYASANDTLVKERDLILNKGKGVADEIKRLEEETNKIKADEKEFNLLKQKDNELKVTLDYLNADLKSKLNEYKNIETELNKYTDISFDNKVYLEKVNKFNALKESVSILYVNLDKIKRFDSVTNSLENTIKIKETLDDKLKEITDNISLLDFNNSKYDKIKVNFEKSQEKLKITKEKYTEEALKLRAKDETERKMLNERLSEIKRKEEEYNAHNQKVSDYAVIEQSLLETKATLMKKINPLINKHFSEIFRTIIDSKYEDIILDDNYAIKISEDGQLYPLEKYSGGERDISNLALRLAISKFLTEINDGRIEFVVLDEIFASLDDERKSALIEVLSSLNKFFKQIFIISHEDTIKSSLENYISIRENEFGYSEITVEDYRIS